MTWQDMQGSCEPLILIIKIVAIQFVLPALIAGYTAYILRKRNIIKTGDMKLEN